MIVASVLLASACTEAPKPLVESKDPKALLDKYAEYTLTTDISHLSENEKEMLPLLFEAADIMEELFWRENCGDKQTFLARIANPDAKKFASITYGPWDGLNNNEPFFQGVGAKPAGAQFYPEDMTEEEWNAFDDPNKSSQYTMIVRDKKGKLKCV